MQRFSTAFHSFNRLFVIILSFCFCSLFSLSLFFPVRKIFFLHQIKITFKTSLCVIFADVLPTALDISSGTSTNSINANFYPSSDWIGEIRPRSRYPYTFPYFLYPPSHKIPLALASHRPDTTYDLYAQYNPNGTKMHFNGHYNHTMHKFPQHFENVSDFDVNNRSDAHEGRSQTQKEMRREFKDIGKDQTVNCTLITISHCRHKCTNKWSKKHKSHMNEFCMNSLNFHMKTNIAMGRGFWGYAILKEISFFQERDQSRHHLFIKHSTSRPWT